MRRGVGQAPLQQLRREVHADLAADGQDVVGGPGGRRGLGGRGRLGGPDVDGRDLRGLEGYLHRRSVAADLEDDLPGFSADDAALEGSAVGGDEGVGRRPVRQGQHRRRGEDGKPGGQEEVSNPDVAGLETSSPGVISRADGTLGGGRPI